MSRSFSLKPSSRSESSGFSGRAFGQRIQAARSCGRVFGRRRPSRPPASAADFRPPRPRLRFRGRGAVSLLQIAQLEAFKKADQPESTDSGSSCQRRYFSSRRSRIDTRRKRGTHASRICNHCAARQVDSAESCSVTCSGKMSTNQRRAVLWTRGGAFFLCGRLLDFRAIRSRLGAGGSGGGESFAGGGEH